MLFNKGTVIDEKSKLPLETPLPELTKRRKNEAQLFNTGKYELEGEKAKNESSESNTTFSDNFLKAMKFIFDVEKGYSNNDNDSGGPTNLGITQKTLNAYTTKKNKAYKNVKDLTNAEALQIYFDDFWLASKANKCSTYALSLVVFDIAVNSGPGTANRIKKKAINKLEKPTFELDITKEMLKLKLQYYKDICRVSGLTVLSDQDKTNLKNRTFFVGWVNRLEMLCKEIDVEIFWSDSKIRDLIKSWGIHAKSTQKYNW